MPNPKIAAARVKAERTRAAPSAVISLISATQWRQDPYEIERNTWQDKN